jgi:hypothetical protein
MHKYSFYNISSWFVLLSVLLIFASCDKEELIIMEEDDETEIIYSFFVAGHVYGAPGVDNIGVHPAFKNNFDLIQNDSTISLGVFTGDIVLTGNETNWDEIDQDVSDLGVPVHFAVGNHDMSDRALYESRYGITYYDFIEQGDLYIVLDPNLDEWNISGDQLDFLKNSLLQAEGVNNIYVFFHQLLWWEEDNIYQNVVLNSLQGRAEVINYWAEVEPLFNGLDNPVIMFAGDVGANPTGDEFVYHTYDNITVIASGMGGNQRDNIVIVDVQRNKELRYRLIALNGDDINALGKLEDYML